MTEDHVPGNVHRALAGLLRELPAPGPWEVEERDKFLTAFAKTFDFIYPRKGVS